MSAPPNRITVIGKGSYLARHLAGHKDTQSWRFLSHRQALENKDNWPEESDVVMNFAFHPDLKSGPYSADKDIDLQLARMVVEAQTQAHSQTKSQVQTQAEANVNVNVKTNASPAPPPQIPHYIMISSRMVYGEPENPDHPVFTEDMPPAPVTPYGINKWRVEKMLAGVIPEGRLTILRFGNIYGYDEAGRDSFAGRMIGSLQDRGEIQFDIAPDSVRDFLPVQQFTDYMIRIAANPKPGLYNLGSGHGRTAQEIGMDMIRHHGSGHIVYRDAPKRSGQFILDMTRTRSVYNFNS